MTSLLASIPSPSQGVWHLGFFPVRAYAFCIIVGIFIAIAVAGNRWARLGHRRDEILDVAMWAVPAGIIGGRLYHVITDWQLYFGSGGRGFVAALRIWDGGLGIWGAISLGFVGGWIAARRYQLPLAQLADAAAPGIVLAQAAGRVGNWFNQELFGKPTTLPWALEIDPQHRPGGYSMYETFHPTFLYELVACVLIAGLLLWAERRFRLGNGQVFALYVFLYSLQRLAVESLRIDSSHHFLGLRLNEYTAIVLATGAFAMFRRRGHASGARSGTVL